MFFTPKESCQWLHALWEHRRNLRLNRVQLEALQRRKFRRLVTYAWQHSPYYRELMRERRLDPATCMPGDFPVLTKQEVIGRFDDLVTDRRITRRGIAGFLAGSTHPMERYLGKYHVLHSSGTSGTVGYFVFSHAAWIKGASHVVRASPLKLGRRRTAFVAATRGHFAGATLMLTGNRGSNRLFYDVRTFDVGRPMPEIIRELNQFQPHMLSGYGTVLKALADAKEKGQLKIRPGLLGNGGEPLSPAVKSALERAFGAPVHNAYASSEHLYMGMTMAGSPGMFLLEDELIFEINPDHICVTNLFNEAMPLIRYRMDDVVVPVVDGPNPYPFTRIQEIVGRTEHALTFVNEHGMEDFIHPIVIVELIIEGLKAWQVLLLDRTSFRFRARMEDGLTDVARAATLQRIRHRLEAILAEKQMANVRFEIEPVEDLGIDPVSGKFSLVVRQPQFQQSPEMAEPSGADHGVLLS